MAFLACLEDELCGSPGSFKSGARPASFPQCLGRADERTRLSGRVSDGVELVLRLFRACDRVRAPVQSDEGGLCREEDVCCRSAPAHGA